MLKDTRKNLTQVLVLDVSINQNNKHQPIIVLEGGSPLNSGYVGHDIYNEKDPMLEKILALYEKDSKENGFKHRFILIENKDTSNTFQLTPAIKKEIQKKTSLTHRMEYDVIKNGLPDNSIVFTSQELPQTVKSRIEKARNKIFNNSIYFSNSDNTLSQILKNKLSLFLSCWCNILSVNLNLAQKALF